MAVRPKSLGLSVEEKERERNCDVKPSNRNKVQSSNFQEF